MQLMLLEQQNKKRLMMARQEQDNMPGMPREGGLVDREDLARVPTDNRSPTRPRRRCAPERRPILPSR